MVARCEYCGKETKKENLYSYLMKAGYSRNKFPVMNYQKKLLCADCLLEHKKRFRLEKFFAALAAGVIILLLMLGIAILYEALS